MYIDYILLYYNCHSEICHCNSHYSPRDCGMIKRDIVESRWLVQLNYCYCIAKFYVILSGARWGKLLAIKASAMHHMASCSEIGHSGSQKLLRRGLSTSV